MAFRRFASTAAEMLSTCTLLVSLCAFPAAGADATEIVILGTLHGMHQKNSHYSLEILRNLITELKPGAILVELPPTIEGQATVKEGRTAERFANDENWSVNAAADALQVPVVAYDRAGRNEIYRETKYFEREAELNRCVNLWRAVGENRKLAPAEAALLGPLLQNAARSRDYFNFNSGPEIINSEGFDRIIRLKHYIWEELMPQLSARIPSLANMAGEFAFFRDEWHDRNRIMADNIIAQARKRPGQRIVVLCGCEHRYILRDLLSSEPDIRLSEYFEAMPPKH